MLISKSDIKANDVVTLRLVNGEEVIGKFVEQTATTVTVSKPFIMQIMMGPKGQGSAALVPLMISADDTKPMLFQKQHVLVGPVVSKQDASRHYLQQTSGLAFANQLPSNM